MSRRSYKRKGCQATWRNTSVTSASRSGRKRIFTRFLKYTLRSVTRVRIATIETLLRPLNEHKRIIYHIISYHIILYYIYIYIYMYILFYIYIYIYIFFIWGRRAAPPLMCPDTKLQRLDVERVCVLQYWSKLYRLLYHVPGRVSSTCANVPHDIVTANLSPRTPTSARGSECSCRTGGPRRVAPAPGQNTRGTRFLATGRLRPDCTSHVTSWVCAMSTATSQSMSSKSHCRIHLFYLGFMSKFNITLMYTESHLLYKNYTHCRRQYIISCVSLSNILMCQET